jgi:hypothetical protein
VGFPQRNKHAVHRRSQCDQFFSDSVVQTAHEPFSSPSGGGREGESRT